MKDDQLKDEDIQKDNNENLHEQKEVNTEEKLNDSHDAETQTNKEENITQNQEQNTSSDASKEIKQTSDDKIWHLSANTKEIKIVPRKKTWLGVINLDENKKRSLDTANSFTIEIGKKQLAVTGHGDINLEIDGQTIKFGDDRPKRFLIEKDKVSLLTYDEFVALNKGKSW